MKGGAPDINPSRYSAVVRFGDGRDPPGLRFADANTLRLTGGAIRASKRHR